MEVMKMVRRMRRKDEEDEGDIFDEWFDDISRRWAFPFTSDIFDEFEEQFRRTQQYMNRVFREAMSGKLPSPEKGGPYVYGWSLRVGPDGKPHFQEFGNVPRTGSAPQQLESREPLVDVIEGKNTISVTAEVPGVDKKDIDLEITENTLIIKVDKDKRKYYKEVELPCEVDANSAKASYQNGVLDIELKKAKPKKKGKKISIE
jgi:HSP20 family protein